MNKKIRIIALTNREKILIYVSIICILLLISFKYIIKPQVIEIANLEKQINNYILEIESNNKLFKARNSIIKEKNKLISEKEKIGGKFFYNLKQPEILYVLNKLIIKSNIDVENISFSKPYSESLNDFEISKIDIDLPFKSDFEALIEMLELIKKEPKKIIINNIEIESYEDNIISGNINLDIYSLVNILEFKDVETDLQITKNNKSNPFIPYIGYVDPRLEIDNDLVEVDIEKTQNNKKLSEEYKIYSAIKGDNISYISMKEYGTEDYVDEILSLNGMKRSSILPIGKKLKLIKR